MDSQTRTKKHHRSIDLSRSDQTKSSDVKASNSICFSTSSSVPLLHSMLCHRSSKQKQKANKCNINHIEEVEEEEEDGRRGICWDVLVGPTPSTSLHSPRPSLCQGGACPLTPPVACSPLGSACLASRLLVHTSRDTGWVFSPPPRCYNNPACWCIVAVCVLVLSDTFQILSPLNKSYNTCQMYAVILFFFNQCQQAIIK